MLGGLLARNCDIRIKALREHSNEPFSELPYLQSSAASRWRSWVECKRALVVLVVFDDMKKKVVIGPSPHQVVLRLGRAWQARITGSQQAAA